MEKLLKRKAQMVRKGVALLVLAYVCTGSAFAQTAVSLDVAPLFAGIIATDGTKGAETGFFAFSPVFEMAVKGDYSLGARVDTVFGSFGAGDGKVGLTYFGLAAFGRWYPLEPLHKMFVSAELGFNTLSMEKVDKSVFTGLTFALRTGWKHTMGAIFLEPSLGYVIAKSNSIMPITPLGWVIGLNIGKAF